MYLFLKNRLPRRRSPYSNHSQCSLALFLWPQQFHPQWCEIIGGFLPLYAQCIQHKFSFTFMVILLLQIDAIFPNVSISQIGKINLHPIISDGFLFKSLNRLFINICNDRQQRMKFLSLNVTNKFNIILQTISLYKIQCISIFEVYQKMDNMGIILKLLPSLSAQMNRKLELVQFIYSKYKHLKDEITNKQIEYLLANNGIISGELEPNPQAYIREYNKILQQSKQAQGLLTQNQQTIQQCQQMVYEILEKLCIDDQVQDITNSYIQGDFRVGSQNQTTSKDENSQYDIREEKPKINNQSKSKGKAKRRRTAKTSKRTSKN